MYEYHETNDGAGRAAPVAGSGVTRLVDLLRHLESLRRFVFGCAVVATAVLTYLIVQSLVTSRDVAVLARDSGMINAKLDALTSKLTDIDEAVEDLAGQDLAGQGLADQGLADLRAEPEPRHGDGAPAPPGPGNWTGVFISDLDPLLPYLAEAEAETGEVWIYSDNEAFLARIGEALQSLEDAGMDVRIERSE